VPSVVERLAVELHRQYRAAEKALNTADNALYGHTTPVTLRHDHGWAGCHRQKYFLKRAAQVIRHSGIESPATLDEAEQALDATVLLRRLQVEGKVPFDGQRHTDRFSRTVGDVRFTPIADRKAERDAEIRKAVFSPRKYTVTVHA